MAITVAELKRYKASVNNDTALNGGRMTSNQVLSGVRNALFPNVSEAERVAGLIRYRKVFVKVANADNLTLFNSLLHLTNITGADDRIEIAQGTQIDVFSGLGTPTMYGCGELHAQALTGATSFSAQVEDASMSIFRTTGNTVWIGDDVNNEYFTNVSATKVDDVYTLTLASGDSLAHTYSTATARVSSVLSLGDIACSFDSVVVTSSAGVFNTVASSITLDNIGTVYDVWTLAFTSPTVYTITGANEGLLVSGGNISGDTSPVNPAFSKKYFTIPSTAFSGTFAIGDTIVFKTYPASIPIWYKETIPAGAGSYPNNTWNERLIGESA
jgi:hypothetical protein